MNRLIVIPLMTSLVFIAVCQIEIKTQVSTFEDAYYAWDAGDYPEALRGMQKLLESPGWETHFEDVALLTGELYDVQELSVDGGSVRFSPDGRYAVYETRSGNATVSHIVNIENGVGGTIEIEGKNVVFSPKSGAIAFLAVRETNEVTEARDAAEESGQTQNLTWTEAKNTRIALRDLYGSGDEDRWLETGDLVLSDLAYSSDGSTLYFTAGSPGRNSSSDIYGVAESGGTPYRITSGDGFKSGPGPVAGGEYLVYGIMIRNPVPQPPQPAAQGQASGFGRRRFRGRTAMSGFTIRDLDSGRERNFTGGSYSLAANGSALAYLARSPGESAINIVAIDGSTDPVEIFTTEETIGTPRIAPNGKKVTFHMMTKGDYEIYILDSGGAGEPKRLSNEIQHDRQPRFITDNLVLGIKGEGRHQRSYIYDINSDRTVKLFHNNTIRTIAPEYDWAVRNDGSKLLVVAERDGDTISPERGVYLVDLNKKVTKEELLQRIETNLESETGLRERGEKMFMPVRSIVRPITEQVSTARIFGYEKDLHDFGSKNITMPGNEPARNYLFETYKSFGYEPELQWFEARGGIRTANVLATLPGTENPEIVYVVSSHFDSSPRGPGADDNTSGTVALLEAARVLSGHPMPATIVFASFTGEESGLLGSREYVKQALANDVNIAGALNNDMLGWSENHRLDNTIRYSNPGIRDLQHAAAFLFTKLITYDALYYKSTDAAAYYEAYGDIVGGIGSYPVLGNPNYHQATDRLETINHALVTEVSKTTVASLILLASSPSRIKGLKAGVSSENMVELIWEPSPENRITHYIVRYGPPDDPMKEEMRTNDPSATLTDIEPGFFVAVKAVNSRGMQGWDWARLVIENE